MCHVLLSIVLLAILAATLINLLALLENILFWQLSDWWDEHVCVWADGSTLWRRQLVADLATELHSDTWRRCRRRTSYVLADLTSSATTSSTPTSYRPPDQCPSRPRSFFLISSSPLTHTHKPIYLLQYFLKFHLIHLMPPRVSHVFLPPWETPPWNLC